MPFFFSFGCVLNCTNDCKICHCVRSLQSIPLYQGNYGNDQLQDFIAWLYFPDKKHIKIQCLQVNCKILQHGCIFQTKHIKCIKIQCLQINSKITFCSVFIFFLDKKLIKYIKIQYFQGAYHSQCDADIAKKV